MNRSLLDRIRMIRPNPDRTSWGRTGGLDASGIHRSSATGHGSRMPSQAVSTRWHRPY